MVFSVRNSLSSHATRYGWIGSASERNSGMSRSVLIFSMPRRWASHSLRRAAPLSVSPVVASRTAPRIAPGSPTNPSETSRFLATVL